MQDRFLPSILPLWLHLAHLLFDLLGRQSAGGLMGNSGTQALWVLGSTQATIAGVRGLHEALNFLGRPCDIWDQTGLATFKPYTVIPVLSLV